MRFAEQSGMSPVEVVDCFREEFWNEITPGEYNRLLLLLVEKAVIWEDKLEIGTQKQRNKIADGGIQKCIKWKSLKTEMLNLRSLCPSGTVPDESGS